MGKIVAMCRNNDFRRAYVRGKSYVSPVVPMLLALRQAGCL